MREGWAKWPRGKIDSLSGSRHTDYDAGVAHPPTGLYTCITRLDYNSYLHLSQRFPIKYVLVSRGILRVVIKRGRNRRVRARCKATHATLLTLLTLLRCNLPVGFERSVRALAARRGQDSLERLPKTATGQMVTIGIIRRTQLINYHSTISPTSTTESVPVGEVEAHTGNATTSQLRIISAISLTIGISLPSR